MNSIFCTGVSVDFCAFIWRPNLLKSASVCSVDSSAACCDSAFSRQSFKYRNIIIPFLRRQAAQQQGPSKKLEEQWLGQKLGLYIANGPVLLLIREIANAKDGWLYENMHLGGCRLRTISPFLVLGLR